MSDRPEGSTARQMVGVGMAAGIGFTVAMFITELALTDPIQQENAKLAILLASVVAAGLSMLMLKGGGAQPVGDATKEESEIGG
jgi:NhaA family Na+:H+ antiporter